MAYTIPKPKRQEKEELYNLDGGISDEKLFELQDDEKTREKEKYEAEQEKIKDINMDLEADNSPIRVKNRFELEVEANGQKHKITRNDLSEYQRKYSLEDGKSDQNAFTVFRSLGTINGNYELLDEIYDDSHRTFNRVDDTSYKTTNVED